MNDHEHYDTWRTYQAAWEDVSSDERRLLLSESVAPDCTYSDPAVECRGTDAIAARIETARAETAGISFVNHEFRHHHRQCVAAWKRLTAAGEVDFVGTSFGRFGDDGRLVQISGFPQPVQ